MKGVKMKYYMGRIWTGSESPFSDENGLLFSSCALGLIIGNVIYYYIPKDKKVIMSILSPSFKVQIDHDKLNFF